MSLIPINPQANAQSPSQIAYQDFKQFDNISSLIYARLQSGIAAVAQVTGVQGQILKQGKSEISAADYAAGVINAIGQDVFNRVQYATTILDGSTPICNA